MPSFPHLDLLRTLPMGTEDAQQVRAEDVEVAEHVVGGRHDCSYLDA